MGSCQGYLGTAKIPAAAGDERRLRLGSSPHPPLSSASSLMPSTDTTFSFSSVSNTITPCVERLAMRMPFRAGADDWPPLVQHDLIGVLRPGTRRPRAGLWR